MIIGLFCCLHQELRRFPNLQSEIAAAATEALEKFRSDSKKFALRLVDMEASYLTVDFSVNFPQEMEKAGNPVGLHWIANLRPIFVELGQMFQHMLEWCVDTLCKSIPKAAVHCQVREAKRSLYWTTFTLRLAKERENNLHNSLMKTQL
ncbi:hypothetical protein O6H91_11G085200 [Diphasiastrum complanatum]|uniref:Uncharacterized protein n=1 Tax=Diphasiastrum complanatum TaxID=34168 RepID=A0ACC2CBE7_DIPCM|nr:hypothetical protein O6H91_11G085200 [Diphasiastrum complanatum]